MFISVIKDKLSLNSWLAVSPLENSKYCRECKSSYEQLGKDVYLVELITGQTEHICENCANSFLKNGAALTIQKPKVVKPKEKKLRYTSAQVNQVDKEFVKSEAWLKNCKKEKDKICSECKKPYTESKYVGLMTLHGMLNQHLCDDCSEKYINLGGIDIRKNRRIREEKENSLLEEYNALRSKLGEKVLTKEELVKILSVHNRDYNLVSHLEIRIIELGDKVKEKYEREHRISLNPPKSWDIPPEYLFSQYKLLVDKDYLCDESDIVPYFNSIDSHDYFKCGQGYYSDEETILVFIANKYYEVKLRAEIGSAKQDRGDRLYWVEKIDKVSYREVIAPKRKIEYFNFKIGELDVEEVKNYLNNKGILYKIEVVKHD